MDVLHLLRTRYQFREAWSIFRNWFWKNIAKKKISSQHIPRVQPFARIASRNNASNHPSSGKLTSPTLHGIYTYMYTREYILKILSIKYARPLLVACLLRIAAIIEKTVTHRQLTSKQLGVSKWNINARPKTKQGKKRKAGVRPGQTGEKEHLLRNPWLAETRYGRRTFILSASRPLWTLMY